jgi:hypothetical protein
MRKIKLLKSVLIHLFFVLIIYDYSNILTIEKLTYVVLISEFCLLRERNRT